jgi:hypothetical protein
MMQDALREKESIRPGISKKRLLDTVLGDHQDISDEDIECYCWFYHQRENDIGNPFL